jgi:hypothetical protein
VRFGIVSVFLEWFAPLGRSLSVENHTGMREFERCIKEGLEKIYDLVPVGETSECSGADSEVSYRDMIKSGGALHKEMIDSHRDHNENSPAMQVNQ